MLRAIDPTGLLISAQDREVRFGPDPARELLFRPSVIRAGLNFLVCTPGEDHLGKTYLIPRADIPIEIAPWRALGMNPVAVSPTGEVYLIGRTRGEYFKWGAGAGLTGPFDTPHATSHLGFAEVLPDGPRMHLSLAVTFGSRKAGFRELKLWQREGPWVFGENDDRWYAFNEVTGLWYLVTDRYSPYCHTGRMVEGRLVIAYNGAGAGYVHESSFTLLPPPATDPQPVPQPQPVPMPAAAPKLPRPVFFSCYDTHSEVHGITPSFVGNVAFPDKGRIRDVPKSLALILAYDTYPLDANDDPWPDHDAIVNRTMYYYLHAAGAGLDMARAQYDFFRGKEEKPFILYYDDRGWPLALPVWAPRDRVLLGGQAYRQPGETIPQFRSAILRMFDTMAKQDLPLVLTPGYDDRGGQLTEAEIRECLPVYMEVAHSYFVVGIMPFADMRRGVKAGQTVGGLLAHPNLRQDVEALYQAVPMRPNRFQYWTPTDPDTRRRALRDQVAYAAAGFTPSQRRRLQALIDQAKDL